eukprot:99024_1
MLSAPLIFVIGRNRSYEFGLNHQNNIDKLTNFSKFENNKNKLIGNIFCGKECTIFVDNDFTNCWISGSNEYGQCGDIKDDNIDQEAINEYQKLRGDQYFINDDGEEEVDVDYWYNYNKQFIKQCKEMTFFPKMNIKTICTNPGSSTIYMIGDDNKVYCNYELIKYFNHNKFDTIIDIQCGNIDIALTSSNNSILYDIIKAWKSLKKISQNVTNDVIKIIISFYNINTVHTQYEENDEWKWKPLEYFKNKHILKIRNRARYAFIFEETGIIYQCFTALTTKKPIINPIQYFITNKIIITDIQCGYFHQLAIDSNNCVYSWGENDDGQCGHGNDGMLSNKITKPTLIKYFINNNLDIIDIQCGDKHSFCKSSNKNYFLFGNNHYNQCIMKKFDKTLNEKNIVSSPNNINNIINEKTNGKEIKTVVLGSYN